MFDDQMPEKPLDDVADTPPDKLPVAPGANSEGSQKNQNASRDTSAQTPQPAAPVNVQESKPNAASTAPLPNEAVSMPTPTPPKTARASKDVVDQSPAFKDTKKGFNFKIFLLILVGLAVVGIAGYIAYTIIVQPANNDGVVNSVPEETVEESVPEETVEVVEVDTDGDGLTDDQEANFGTSAKLVDTDKDGLNDREEIRVYDTDPLDPDTDNDNFLDGEEVNNGYNPNGEGKLFDLPK